MAYNNIQLESDGHVAVLTINRPKALNALNDETLTEIDSAFDSLLSDGQTRVMILTGAEKAFVAGADIGELLKADAEGGKQISIKGNTLFKKIEDADIVSIAAVNGFALGGGCELAMACDIRIASVKAKLGQPEVNLGVIPGYGGTQRLSRLVGKGKAKELILTGDMLTAEDAQKIGLVEKVVDPEALMDEAQKMAKKIASKGPIAVKLSKKAINYGSETNLDDGIAFEIEKFKEIFGSDDKNEGTQAFLEKRAPNFQNK
jgi:enoyl-CoA hydratase